jgi:hypothetical protein
MAKSVRLGQYSRGALREPRTKDVSEVFRERGDITSQASGQSVT